MDDVTPQDWRMPVPVRLIDVAKKMRDLYGADVAAEMFPHMPQRDYRFQVALPGGAEVTLHRGATAAHLVAHLLREGIDLASVHATDADPPADGVEPSLPTERS